MLLRSGLAVFHLLHGTWTGLPEETAILLRELSDYALGRLDVELVSGCLALARGDLDEAGERLGTVTALVRETGAYEVLPVAVGSAVRVASARGDMAGALDTLGILGHVDAMDAKGVWPTACWVLPSAVETWVNAGQRAEAHRFLDRAGAGLRGLDAPLAPAALSYGRGILTGSANGLVTAADLYEAVPMPYEAARASERGAGLLFDAGEAPAAEVQLKRALLTYDRIGATWDHARAARLARQHGIALTRRHGGGRRSYGTELSPQERTVAELAALGHTNKEIAAKLFISYRTVDKHMGSIMRKKGARSRAELAYRLASAETAGESKNGEITP
jgi:DNA-binding CsgD family transcriptional regulator